MPEFKVVVNDPEAGDPRPILVKVVGSDDLKYDEKHKEGKAMIEGKMNPKTFELLKAPYKIITLRIWKDRSKGEKVNFTIRVTTDDSVPEFTLLVPSALLAEKVGEEEVLGEVFRAKAFQVTVTGDKAAAFLEKRIGDYVDSSVVGIPGMKLLITGGSDNTGFPMLKTLSGGVKKALLLSGPPGFHPKNKGERRRKYVRGNTITEDIVQINTKLVKEAEA